MADLKLKALYERSFGLIFNAFFIIAAWIYNLFFRGFFLSHAELGIFGSGENTAGPLIFLILLSASVCEAFGAAIKAMRIRHIKKHPELYGEFYSPQKDIASDFPLAMFLVLAASRFMFAVLTGIIAFRLIGLAQLEVLGAVLFALKDGILYGFLFVTLSVPREKKVPGFFNLLANILLVIFGLFFAGVGWESFMALAYDNLPTIRNWQGFTQLLIGILVLVFMYFFLLFPTRLGFQLEESVFVDTGPEKRKYLLSFGATILLSILPWLL